MNSVFISYSKKDKIWLEDLKKHLNVLKFEHSFEVLDDTKIGTGKIWKDEIFHFINKSKVFVLLVSSNFLATEFIMKVEMPEIIKIANKENAVIIPVIIDICNFELIKLTTYQYHNNPKRPISSLSSIEINQEWVSLTSKILDEIGKRHSFLHESNNFNLLLLLAVLIKTGPKKTITEIINTSLKHIERKKIVEDLNRLKRLKYIEHIKGDKKQNPSDIWKGSDLGKEVFLEFEKTYLDILNLPKTSN